MLDIETAPNTAHVWGLWDQRIGINQLLESSYVLCWSAKWYQEKEIMFERVKGKKKAKRMLDRIHKLLSEADAVVHYNGTKFDIPTLNKEFLLFGFTPPPPSKQIDLLRVARSRFKFPSNRLDYVANALGLGKKHKHEGHELWIKCMAGDPKAWETMERYNKKDVLLLEKVYDKLKPWIKNHANHGLYSSGKCPTCGSDKAQARGWAYTSAFKYRRFQCTACAHWFRSAKAEPNKIEERFRSI